MRAAFDEVKGTQAAARLLRLAGGSLNYMALIKMLYRADRMALAQLGLPITTDRYASMRYGPVTSNIYDRIKDRIRPSFWTSHIQRSDRTVTLANDPGGSELSRAEERVIDQIYASDGDKDPFVLADECHKQFPEWEDPGASSSPIEIEDIIAAIGLSEDEAEQVRLLIDKQAASSELAL